MSSTALHRLLRVRELENLFLDPDLLTVALAERAELLGIEAPSRSDIQERLDAMLQDHEEKALYTRPPPERSDPRESVRGAEVLRRLYWDTTVSTYDKLSDGKRLAELADEHKPELLDPLREIVGKLVDA